MSPNACFFFYYYSKHKLDETLPMAGGLWQFLDTPAFCSKKIALDVVLI